MKNHIAGLIGSIVCSLALAGCDPAMKESARSVPSVVEDTTIQVEEVEVVLPTSSAGIDIWEGHEEGGALHTEKRLLVLDGLAPAQDGVLFLGDSITEFAPLDVLFPEVETQNYGIGWDTTDGIILRLSQVSRNSPERLFLLIGTNDLYYGHSSEHIAKNVGQIVDRLYGQLPSTDLFILSLLPRGADYVSRIKETNDAITEVIEFKDARYLNISSEFSDENGVMLDVLSTDGLHLNEAGYARLAELISDCVVTGCKEENDLGLRR